MSFWLASIYSSSSFVPFEASAATEIKCERTGTAKVTCCQDHVINRSPANPAGTLVTYCTDCEVTITDVGYLGYTNCSERYIEMSAEEPGLPVPPSAVARLQEGGLPEEATILPDVSVNEAQRANITILPGGILQEDNTSSNDKSEQSDLASDKTENTTIPANDGVEIEEQEESGPSKGQAREGTDDSGDQENIDEELPLE